MANPTTTPLLNSNDTLLGMSDDGNLISFVETAGQNQSLYTLDVNSGQKQLITTGTDITGGIISANGQYLLYSNGASFFIKDLQDNSAPYNVTPQVPANADITPQAISNDGLTIVFGEEDLQYGLVQSAEEVVENLVTGTQQKFSDANSAAGTNVTLTPDGRYLSYWEGGFIVRDLTTGSYVRPALLPGSISENGRYTFYDAPANPNGLDDTELFLHDNNAPSGDLIVSTSADGQIANGNAAYFVALSGDGRHVVFSSDATNLVPGVTDGSPGNLYVKNLDTGAISLVEKNYIAPVDVANVFISYDGSRIFTQGSNGVTLTQYAAPSLTVNPVSTDDLINGHEPVITVSGTSDAIGQTVHLSIEGTTDTASAIVQANGTWSTLWFIGTAPSPDGIHTIDATVTDELSTTTKHPFTVDTTPPSLILYSVNGGAIVNAAEASSIAISGFATDGSINPSGISDESGQPVSLSVDNKSIGTPQVFQNGSWAFQYDGASLSDGQHELDYSVADKAGNVAKGSVYFEVDKTPPKIAITSIGDNNVITAAEYRNGALIQGTSDAIGGTVDVNVNGNDLKATVAADGTWQTAATFSGSSAGSYTVSASVADEAGNIGSATATASVNNGIIEVSTDAKGASGLGQFQDESVSGDGHIVAFDGVEPEYSGLVPVSDTADSLPVTAQDVYVKNVQTGAITVISKMLNGAAPDGDSWLPTVSENGQFVAFLSDATDLVADDTNGSGTAAGLGGETPGVDVFVTNLATGVTVRADTTSSGAQVAGTTVDEAANERPAISADGRYVAFVSDATGLVAGVSGTQVYLKDLHTGDISLVSVDSSGSALTGSNQFPSMSADGRYIAFLSGDINSNTGIDVYVRDMQTGTSTLVSSTAVTAADLSLSGQRDGHVAISSDGQYVAFDSPAGPGSNSMYGIQTVIHNLATGQETTIPDVYVAGGFSADDQFITVIQREENGDFGNIGLYDLKTGALSLLPGNLGGNVSADGNYAVFGSVSPLLAASANQAGYGNEFTYLQELQSSSSLIFAPVMGSNQIATSQIHDVPLTGTSSMTGGTVTIAIDGTQVATALVGSNGTWLTDIDISAFASGSHSITASIPDTLGFTVSAGEIVQIAAAQSVAEDGYIAGATVSYANGSDNGATATTDAQGSFTLTGGSGPLILTGGTDTATGLAFTGTLEAPNGSTVLSPLTTLVEKAALAMGDDASAAGIAAANASVIKALGLPAGTDLTTLDAVAGTQSGDQAATAAFKAGSELLDTMTLIQAAGGSADAAYAALAADITAAAAAGTTVNLTANGTIATIAQAAGLDPAEAQAIATIAAQTGAALEQQLAGTTSPHDIFIDITGASIAEQGNAASALVHASGDTGYQQAANSYLASLGTLLSQDDAAAAGNVACYVSGTLIATDKGEAAVDDLRIGDQVVVMSGQVSRIKWIGKRSYSGRFILGRGDILPICIKAGGLGENKPHRDLWVSPHHAMFFENAHRGILIEAKDLVNGVSIVQARAVDEVSYFHIELDTHDVIIANGAPSETFLDDDSRAMFHNAHEFAALYPKTACELTRYYAPRLDHGFEVERVRQNIAAIAGIAISPERALLNEGRAAA